MTTPGKRTGRRRRYAEPTVKGTLHLPPAFWRVLEETGGSVSEAFARTLETDRGVRRMRRALRRKDGR